MGFDGLRRNSIMNNIQTQAPKRKWLPIGWKVMVAYGIQFIFFGIFVPVSSYFTLPDQPMAVFGLVDEKFTGLAWNQVISLGPDFGLWIVLTMVSMCAMMITVGVLTFQISRYAYREGKRWAWKTLVIANLLLLAYYTFFIGGLHMARGLRFWTFYPGASGVVADGFIVVTVIFLYFGLWLPRKELVD